MTDRFEIPKSSDAFPSHLRQFEWCPDMLYGRGDPGVLRRGVGIIGARKATPYGLKAASTIARWCAELDVPVYSGAAIGCDQAAHKGALEGQGATVAVLGCGADIIYPASATGLFADIVKEGCVLSHFTWGTRPKRYTFIERNRLIVAFSYVLVVVEGRMPSGTFSAVNWAEQLNVDIAAVPGSIFSPESSGPNHLVSNGAVPLCTRSDLRDALALTIDYEDDCQVKAQHVGLSRDEKVIFEMLRSLPLSVDEVARMTQMTTITVLVSVNMLELKGLVTRLPDGRFLAVD